MKIIYNNIIPLRGYAAINIFGIILARKEYKPLSDILINHESIHTAQMRELLYVFFYLFYFLEWIVRVVQYGGKAYYNISFEREAYRYEKNLHFLKARKKFNWVTFLKNRTSSF